MDKRSEIQKDGQVPLPTGNPRENSKVPMNALPQNRFQSTHLGIVYEEISLIDSMDDYTQFLVLT